MKINNFEIKTGLMLFFLLPALMWANFGRVWVQETVYESVSETFLPPTPSVISANGPLTFCIGDSVMLSGNTRGTWNTGDTTSSIIIKSSGDYFVTNTDSTGSISSNHLIVKVDSIPIASIITANDTIVFCNGDSVRLSGNAGGIWNTGDTSGSIVVRTSGDYFVTNSNTCDTVVSNHILITVKGADTSVISANKSTTLCMGDSIILSGNVNGTWSTGDTAFSINVKTSGNYFVIVTGACGSDTTNHIMVRFDTIPVVSVGCTENLVTGRKQLSLVSEPELQAMAIPEYQTFLSQNKVLNNKDAEMVQRVGSRIAAAIKSFYDKKGQPSVLAGYSWEFKLVEKAEVNAWCMPGGKVVVYTGLLPIMLNTEVRG